MLVVFLPIFVADTKIIMRYDFVVPLMYKWLNPEAATGGVP